MITGEGRVNKKPCPVCHKAVIYLGAEYCSYECQVKGMSKKSDLVWHNARNMLPVVDPVVVNGEKK